jgi:hypothetical protein
LALCPPLLCLPLLTGCLYHTRKLQAVKPSGTVMSADATQLAGVLIRNYDAIQTLSATVDMQASVGGNKKGSVTDYTSFRGFILVRKPAMLRVIGLLPVVRTQAFDLASDGKTFKLLIPPKNEAVEGSNSLTTRSSNPLMNLRPGMFLDSMLIRGVGAGDEVFLTLDSTVSQDAKTKKWTEQRDYLLWFVRPKIANNPSDVPELIPEREVRFSGDTLQPIEQDIYDQEGKNIETIALYGPLQTFGKERFPGTIVIKRPLEEYQIVLTIQKLVLNQTLGDDQFDLKIPDGVQIHKMD